MSNNLLLIHCDIFLFEGDAIRANFLLYDLFMYLYDIIIYRRKSNLMLPDYDYKIQPEKELIDRAIVSKPYPFAKKKKTKKHQQHNQRKLDSAIVFILS